MGHAWWADAWDEVGATGPSSVASRSSVEAKCVAGNGVGRALLISLSSSSLWLRLSFLRRDVEMDGGDERVVVVVVVVSAVAEECL